MPEIELERRDDGIAVLTLNAPDRRNALTVAMAEALTAACEEIDADAGVGAVVVRGEGGYFCAGGDRQTLAAAGRDPAEDERYRGMSAIYRSFARVGELAPADGRRDPRRSGRRRAQPRARDRSARGRRGREAAVGLHPDRPAPGRRPHRAARPARLARGRRRADAVRRAAGPAPRPSSAASPGRAVPDAEVDGAALALAAIPAKDPDLARRTAASLRTVTGPPALPWNAALELERASQMWSMRRKAD